MRFDVASSGSPTFPWVLSFLLAAPAFGLAVASGFVGIDTATGAGLAGAGVLYLGVELLALQPKIERRALAVGRADAAAQQFLEDALAVGGVDEVAAELGRAVTAALGGARAILLAPGPEGGVRTLVASGPALRRDLGDPTAAFLWLSDAAEPLRREQIEALVEFEGAAATLELLDAVECNVLLPLRHRGLLLGLALIAEPHPGAAPDSFYRALRAYATVAMANTFLHAETTTHGHLAKSFDLANAMQESIMPDERPVRRRHVELRGLFRPVAACGGDLWTWRELSGDRVLVVIADATGHGAAPALLSAVAKGAIDAFWQMHLDDLDPAALLTAVNRAVHRTGRKRYQMTAFAAVIDPRANQLVYANAGQNFPFFVGIDGRVEPLVARGNTLGATSEARYETHRRPMKQGDKLFLYTDGLTEAASPQGEAWGEKRLRALLGGTLGAERAGRIPELIMAELERFLQGAVVDDDITLVACERLVEGQESSA